MNELTKINDIPEHLMQYQGQQAGLEDIKVTDLKMPSLLIAQGLSEVVKQALVKYGSFFNSVTNESLGDKVVIIVSKVIHNWMYFPGDDEKEAAQKEGKQASFKKSADGLIWDDGTELTKDDKFKCEQYSFFCIVRNNLQLIPYVLTMRKTSRKAGKDFYQMIGGRLASGTLPIYSYAYEISHKTEQNKAKQDYLVFKAQPAGWATAEEAALAATIRDSIQKYEAAHEKSMQENIEKDYDSTESTSNADQPETTVISDEDVISDME